jgi:glycosyltransferase involved in cell wall biosynthesis
MHELESPGTGTANWSCDKQDRQNGIEQSAVAVVIPTYRHAAYIAKTLDSVLAQTRPAAQIIVVNDGSPDDTDSAVGPYLDRITYIVQPNAGPSAAINRGLSMVRCEYVLTFASDDWLAPGALAHLAPILDTHQDVGVVYADVNVVDSEGRLTDVVFEQADSRLSGKHDATRSLFRRNFVPAPATLIRLRAVQEAAFYPRHLYCQDWALLLRVALNGWLFYGLGEKLAYYRSHPANLTATMGSRQAAQDVVDMFGELARDIGALNPHYRRCAIERLRESQRRLAWFDLAHGCPTASGRAFLRLLALDGQRLNSALGLCLSVAPGSAYRVCVNVRSRIGPVRGLTDRVYRV